MYSGVMKTSSRGAVCAETGAEADVEKFRLGNDGMMETEDEKGQRRGGWTEKRKKLSNGRTQKKKVKHGSEKFGNFQRNDEHPIGGTSCSGQTRVALIACLVLVVRVHGHGPERVTRCALGHLPGHVPGLVPGRVPGGAHHGYGGVLGRLDSSPKKIFIFV